MSHCHTSKNTYTLL